MKKPTQFLRTNAAQRTLALFVVATMATVPAWAANRAPRLHPATHTTGHVVITHSETAHDRSRHASRYEVAEARTAKRGKKAGAVKNAPAPSKSHAKDARNQHHEPEYVDDPVVMHRASTHGHKLTRRERAQELAEERQEARYEAAHHTHAASRREAVHDIAARDREYAEPATRYVPRVSEPTDTHYVARASEPSDSHYTSREFTASYDNVSRGVDQAVRPNAYTRHSSDTSIGTALRTTPDATGSSRSALPANDPVSEQARRSSVVVRRPGPQAQVSASDAPLPTQQYQPRVASGFGAEIAPLPSRYPRNAATESTLAAEAQDLGEDLAANGVASAHTLANDAMQPLVTPMYSREGSLMMPAPLRGSHEILVHQNVMADHDGLERIRDDNQLNRLRADRQLVSFPETASLRVNEGLPENRRYARPWTVQFATDAARAFYHHFGEPLQVNSAVRTVSYQLRLQRVNGNAAATRGEGASPHLTGQAIDLAKRGMSADEIGWMRSYLLPFIDAGKIDVEEEFQQACFHISVYRAYVPSVRRPVTQVAQVRSLPSTSPTTLPEGSEPDR